MTDVFIDGSAGTTGLRIHERLSQRDDIHLAVLPEDKRKDPVSRREALNSADIAFLCLPDDAAREAVAMTDSDTVIIDTSTAHRTDPDWAYGFPELSPSHLSRVINSKRIAVPGCHASGFIALVYPLAEAGIIKKDMWLECFSVTGYSGGGKKMIAEYESPQRSTLLSAPRMYALCQSHKHLPEMTAVPGLLNPPVFCPVVADYYSGMEVTVPLFLSQTGASADDIRRVYREKYTGSIVRFAEDESEDGFLSANALSGLDTMTVSVFAGTDRVLLTARFDNLGKGASGAAIECMNLKLGCDPTKGLNINRK